MKELHQRVARIHIGVLECTDVVQFTHQFGARPSTSRQPVSRPHGPPLQVQPGDGIVQHRIDKARHVESRVPPPKMIALLQLREHLVKERLMRLVIRGKRRLVGPWTTRCRTSGGPAGVQ